MAYLDEDDKARAQSEFETAVTLDPKFPGAFLNLGRLALSQNNYTLAASQLHKAAVIRPADPDILTALAYAQHGSHQYREAIETVGRVHAMQHPGMGNAHYVAAVAAVALNDFPVARHQLALFLEEDPSNPLAPTARYNLDILNRSQQGAITTGPTAALASTLPPNLANSDRLKAQLAGVEDEVAGCDHCANFPPSPKPIREQLRCPLFPPLLRINGPYARPSTRSRYFSASAAADARLLTSILVISRFATTTNPRKKYCNSPRSPSFRCGSGC
jgi:tetratricopeptide (TPR) repeat protein